MIPHKIGPYLDVILTLNPPISTELLCMCKHSVQHSWTVIGHAQLLVSENWGYLEYHLIQCIVQLGILFAVNTEYNASRYHASVNGCTNFSYGETTQADYVLNILYVTSLGNCGFVANATKCSHVENGIQCNKDMTLWHFACQADNGCMFFIVLAWQDIKIMLIYLFSLIFIIT